MPPWIPASAPVNTTSTASSCTPAWASRYASGTPVQTAVPTPSSRQGWLSGRGRKGTARSGAFQGHRDADLGARWSAFEAELHGTVHGAADPQVPVLGIDERDVEVVQQVVQAGRRDVVPQRFQGHGMIPVGELEFLGRQRPVARFAGMRRELLGRPAGSSGRKRWDICFGMACWILIRTSPVSAGATCLQVYAAAREAVKTAASPAGLRPSGGGLGKELSQARRLPPGEFVHCRRRARKVSGGDGGEVLTQASTCHGGAPYEAREA